MIRIDGWPIDIAVSESYNLESEATTFPVEQGGDVTDHVRLTPLTITIDCVVSDSPTGAIAADETRLVQLDDGTPSSDTFAKLVAIRDARQPVTYEGARGTFENMVLSFQVPVSIETSGGLHFTATLKQIEFVSNKRITVRPASTPRAGGKVDRGAIASLSKVGGLKSELVFTIRPGARKPTWLGGRDPGAIFFTSAAGNHYRAEQGAIADGYVDATGYHKFGKPIPTNIDIVPVTSDGTPIPQETDYISPLDKRIGPQDDPTSWWNSTWGD